MKTKTPKEFAREQECTIILPGCTGGGETSVLCHWRDSSTGIAKKEHDLIAAHGCYNCHSIVDGHVPLPPGYSREKVNEIFKTAIIKTQQKVIRAIRAGKVRVKF